MPYERRLYRIVAVTAVCVSSSPEKEGTVTVTETSTAAMWARPELQPPQVGNSATLGAGQPHTRTLARGRTLPANRSGLTDANPATPGARAASGCSIVVTLPPPSPIWYASQIFCTPWRLFLQILSSVLGLPSPLPFLLLLHYAVASCYSWLDSYSPSPPLPPPCLRGRRLCIPPANFNHFFSSHTFLRLYTHSQHWSNCFWLVVSLLQQHALTAVSPSVDTPPSRCIVLESVASLFRTYKHF